MNISNSLKSFILATSLAVSGVFGLTGCSSSTASTRSSNPNAVVILDDTGTEQVVPFQPKSVAILTGSYADMWTLAGGLNSLTAAAHDSFTTFDLPQDKNIADLGAIKEPNKEVLLNAEPDLVIGSSKQQSSLDLADELRSQGTPVLLFDVNSFEDYLRVLKNMTTITGDEQAYQTYGLDQQKAIQKFIDSAPVQGPTTLYLRAAGSKVKAMNSTTNVLGVMLKDLNTQNIVTSNSGLEENLSMEKILEEDPEYIFLVVQGSDPTKAQTALEDQVLSNPAWAELSAVKNGRVYTLDQDLFNVKPNARWAEAYEILDNILYGE